MYKLFVIAILLQASVANIFYQVNDPYYVSETNATFIHAITDCKLRGLSLARVENATVQTGIVTFLSSLGFQNSSIFWVAGVHRNNDAWVWIETGQYVNYTSWALNQPTYPGTGDYCLQLGKDHANATVIEPWLWEAQLCNSQNLYLCQRT